MEDRESKIDFNYCNHFEATPDHYHVQAKQIINDAYDYFVENHVEVFTEFRKHQDYLHLKYLYLDREIDIDEYLFCTVDKIKIEDGVLIGHLRNNHGDKLKHNFTSISMLVYLMRNNHWETDHLDMFVYFFVDLIKDAEKQINTTPPPPKKEERGWFSRIKGGTN